MRNFKVPAALAAMALVAAPVAAQVDLSRAAAPVDAASELGNEDSTTRVLTLLGVAAAIAALVALTDDDDPVSA